MHIIIFMTLFFEQRFFVWKQYVDGKYKENAESSPNQKHGKVIDSVCFAEWPEPSLSFPERDVQGSQML